MFAFPAALTVEEKKLKEFFERIKKIRKTIGNAAKNASGGGSSMATGAASGKTEMRVHKKSVEAEEFATAEVRKKVMSGVITVKKKPNEQRQTFKRVVATVKRRDGDTLSGSASVSTAVAEKRESEMSDGEVVDETVAIGSSSHSAAFADEERHEHPTVYIRGYDLVTETLENAFGRFGKIEKINIDDRRRSAVLTFSCTDEAKTAIAEMDGNLLNGIGIRCSFARNPTSQSSSFVIPFGKRQRMNDSEDGGECDSTSNSNPSNNFTSPTKRTNVKSSERGSFRATFQKNFFTNRGAPRGGGRRGGGRGGRGGCAGVNVTDDGRRFDESGQKSEPCAPNLRLDNSSSSQPNGGNDGRKVVSYGDEF